MAEPGVGSDQDEQVREPGDRRAAVRLRPTGPHLSQGASLPAANPSSHRHIRDVKSGAQDNRVYLPSGAVGGLHPIRAGSGHARRHHLDVRLGQGGQVVVGDQNALAADGVVRGQLARSSGSSTWRRRCLSAVISASLSSRGLIANPAPATRDRNRCRREPAGAGWVLPGTAAARDHRCVARRVTEPRQG